MPVTLTHVIYKQRSKAVTSIVSDVYIGLFLQMAMLHGVCDFVSVLSCSPGDWSTSRLLAGIWRKPTWPRSPQTSQTTTSHQYTPCMRKSAGMPRWGRLLVHTVYFPNLHTYHIILNSHVIPDRRAVLPNSVPNRHACSSSNKHTTSCKR